MSPAIFRSLCASSLSFALCGVLQVVDAAEVPTLDTVEVHAQDDGLLGSADSANVGNVTREQLETRTAYRPGELLEATPGLIVSQHSGEGKANQFYLRGINLDHGTDLRTTVDGMLVNQRSHSHGQGWTDLNFLIPELATGLQYQKGPYYAAEGDFASAGTVSLGYADQLQQGIASLGVGSHGFRRTLLADSPKFGDGHLLYALELLHNDGPFVHPDDYRKVNAVLRYSEGNAANGLNVAAMAYRGKWHSTDQITQRALDSGLLSSRFDAIDPTDGGESHRYSLSGAWRQTGESSSTQINAYVIATELQLFSNFTYFLNDSVHGDQFAQPDRRTITALNASHTWEISKNSENSVGVQFQNDNIYNGLFSTQARQVLSTTRKDHIVESSLALYLENRSTWAEKFRSVLGVRGDLYRFDVQSSLAANSGKVTDNIVSPKLSLIFGPWDKTEYYVNLGSGFHSNDARGTTITQDPKTGDPATRVSPLSRAKGYEVGVRTSAIANLQSTFSLYILDSASELVFAGDAGTTEAGRASRRTGFEFTNLYKATDWLNIDADAAYAQAHFRDNDPIGNHIPGAVEGVASLSASVDHLGPYYGALQFRYFGPRPLIEDNSVRSKSTALVNGHIGYKFSRSLRVELEGFNLFDQKASAIDYYYTSRLPGEAAQGVDAIHFHPTESRSFRLAMVANF